MPTRRRISFWWLFHVTELVYLVQKLRNLRLILPCKVQSFQPHRLATVIYSLKCYMFSVNIRVFNMYTHKQRQPGVWKGEKKNWRLEWKDHCLTQCLKIAYRIFSVYQKNTKIIHLIMMIWLFSFFISNYRLASGPPKDPGGSKKILSKSRIWFIEFSP